MNSKLNFKPDFFLRKNRWKYLIPFYSFFLKFFNLEDNLANLIINLSTIGAFLSIFLRSIYVIIISTDNTIPFFDFWTIIVIAGILSINAVFRIYVSCCIFVFDQIVVKDYKLMQILDNHLKVIPFEESAISEKSKDLQLVNNYNSRSGSSPDPDLPNNNQYFSRFKRHLKLNYLRPSVYLVLASTCFGGIVASVSVLAYLDNKEKNILELKQNQQKLDLKKEKLDIKREKLAEIKKQSSLQEDTIREMKRQNELSAMKIKSRENKK